MDYRRRDLDAWDKVVEKAGDAEAKTNLQPPFYIREIDSKCPKGYPPSVKKDKEDTNQEHRNKASKDKDKVKTILRLPLISLRPRPPRSITVDEKALQLLGSTPPR